MAADSANLCTERHYMGSSSSGRYSTDRSEPPRYWHPPYPETVAQAKAARTAWMTRFLRKADVVWWVTDHAQACEDIAECDAAIETLAARIDSPAPDEAESPQMLATYMGLVACKREMLLDRKREASRQLRLIGISPKEQALILRELRRREAAGA